jgi:hypothetical protein
VLERILRELHPGHTFIVEVREDRADRSPRPTTAPKTIHDEGEDT